MRGRCNLPVVSRTRLYTCDNAISRKQLRSEHIAHLIVDHVRAVSDFGKRPGQNISLSSLNINLDD